MSKVAPAAEIMEREDVATLEHAKEIYPVGMCGFNRVETLKYNDKTLKIRVPYNKKTGKGWGGEITGPSGSVGGMYPVSNNGCCGDNTYYNLAEKVPKPKAVHAAAKADGCMACVCFPTYENAAFKLGSGGDYQVAAVLRHNTTCMPKSVKAAGANWDIMGYIQDGQGNVMYTIREEADPCCGALFGIICFPMVMCGIPKGMCSPKCAKKSCSIKGCMGALCSKKKKQSSCGCCAGPESGTWVTEFNGKELEGGMGYDQEVEGLGMLFGPLNDDQREPKFKIVAEGTHEWGGLKPGFLPGSADGLGPRRWPEYKVTAKGIPSAPARSEDEELGLMLWALYHDYAYVRPTVILRTSTPCCKQWGVSYKTNPPQAALLMLGWDGAEKADAY